MAFPTNPTDGQMHNGYTYNSAKGAWIIINEYDSEGNLDINRDVEINGTLNIIDSETRNTTESSSNYATPLLINGTPIVESGSNSDGEWTRWRGMA